MKSIKTIRTFLVCTLLISFFIVQAMDKPSKKKKTRRIPNWALIIGDILIGNVPIQAIQQITQTQEPILQNTPIAQGPSFEDLPIEVRTIIINSLITISSASDLHTIGKTLKALTLTNKELNRLINNPTFCLALIKHYAKIFDTYDATICSMLQSKCAKKRLAIQNSLINDICLNSTPEKSRFEELINLGADVYFTDALGYTPAEQCIVNYNKTGLKMLLSMGVDPEFVGKNGISLFDLAASRLNRELAHEMMQELNGAIQEKHALKN